MTTEPSTGDLCYLQAGHVESPTGTLAGLDLVTEENETLGTIEGVLIEPAARRLRYFVVAARGWLGKHRYLLPADTAARIEHDEHILRVDARPDEVTRLKFDPGSVRAFSDDDLITAMFAPQPV